jgi:5-methylcytosine-specific restriction enzyme subunit McrC
MKQNNSKIFYEYKDKTFEDAGLEPQEADALESFLARKKLSEVFSFSRSKITAKNYVGVLKYKKHQFEILPKLLAKKENDSQSILENLFHMLSYTRKLDIKTTDIAKLAKNKNHFLEVLIGIFANSLYENLLRFIPKNYVLQEENLAYLKGKLRFNENVKYNSINKARFYCEYDEFCEDNLLNQLFYYVSVMLSKITSNEDNKKRLKQIINLYSDVSFIEITSEKIRNLKLSRIQMNFEKPFNLAKMFIEQSSVEMSSRKFKTIALVWDMNLLFEEFIYEFIRKNFKDIKVEYQKKAGMIKESYFRQGEEWQKKRTKSKITRSDIVITLNPEAENEQKIIIDTKYKELDKLQSNFASADFYQVLAYKQLHSKKGYSPEVVLLYPQSLSENSEFRWRHTVNNENKDHVYMFSVNLHNNLKNDEEKLYDEIKNLLELMY